MINSFLVGASLYFLGGLAVVLATIVGVVCTTCSDLIKQEAATRLERFPLWLLTRAALGLPEDCRDEIFENEWLPELQYISRRSEGLPLTRLYHSIRFAIRLLGGPAIVIGESLKVLRTNDRPQLDDRITIELAGTTLRAWVDFETRLEIEGISIAEALKMRDMISHGFINKRHELFDKNTKEMPAWLMDPRNVLMLDLARYMLRASGKLAYLSASEDPLSRIQLRKKRRG